MAPLSIIDSHIHLWPESMANEQGHAWMTPGMPLAKPQIPEDYFRASEQQQEQEEQQEQQEQQEKEEEDDPSSSSSSKPILKGIIYVETDVRYSTPPPTTPTPPTISSLQSWTRGPLQEIQFLRSIITGSYGSHASGKLLGIVAWAPMTQPPLILSQWLQLVQDEAGEQTWLRIKGFRYLLQFISEKEVFENVVVRNENLIENLEILGQRGLVFDVGVDQRSGGIWQLEGMVRVMQKVWARGEEKGVPVEERVVFVINHFCKPSFFRDGEDEGEEAAAGKKGREGEFQAWQNAVTSMAKFPNTYMKLSGAFSELPEHVLKGGDCDAIARYMMPWVDVVLSAFGPERVMFGSDWPVCNLRGPAGERSWPVWKNVVSRLLESCIYQGTLLTDQQKSLVWSGTAQRAYRLA